MCTKICVKIHRCVRSLKEEQHLRVVTCSSLHHDIAELTPPVKNTGSVMNASIVSTVEIRHVYYTL